ncbi:MAG: hypothetical protein JRI95_13865, partial [Deltaproteobacteria bacterium]|nr:hypothetical protein [Deltaproteobacteria bacterium]
MARKLKLELIVDDKGSVKVKQFGDKTESELKGVGRAMDRLDKKTKASAGHWKSLIAVVGGFMAISKIKSWASEWIEYAGAQQQATAGMEQSMRSMGRYSPELKAQLLSVASALQEVTTFGDEATIEGQKFLLTYKNITDDLLPRTSAIMLDLAALMGGDTRQAANMLGKASMGLSGELRRVGITIDEDIAKSNDFAAILGEIEKQVGGQAQALAQTGYGGLKQLGNLAGDAKEKLGDLILLVMDAGVFDELKKQLKDINEDLESWIENNDDLIAQKVPEYIDAIKDSASGLYDVLVEIKPLVSFMAEHWEVFAGAYIGSKFGKVGAIIGAGTGYAAKLYGEYEKEKEAFAIPENQRKALNREINEIFGYMKPGISDKSFENYRKRVHDLIVQRNELRKVMELENAGEFPVARHYTTISKPGGSGDKGGGTGGGGGGGTVKDWADEINLWGMEWVDAGIAMAAADKEAKGLNIDFSGLTAAIQKQIKLMQYELSPGYAKFFKGVEKGLKDTIDDWQDWAEMGETLTRDMLYEVRNTFSDTLYYGLKGDFDSIGDAWEGMLDSMLRSSIDIFSQIAMSYAATGLLSLMGFRMPGMSYLPGFGLPSGQGGGTGLGSTALTGYGLYSLLGGGGGAATLSGGVSGISGAYAGANLVAGGTGASTGLWASIAPYAPYAAGALAGWYLLDQTGIGTALVEGSQDILEEIPLVGGVASDIVGGIGNIFGFETGTPFVP